MKYTGTRYPNMRTFIAVTSKWSKLDRAVLGLAISGTEKVSAYKNLLNLDGVPCSSIEKAFDRISKEMVAMGRGSCLAWDDGSMFSVSRDFANDYRSCK